MPRLVIIKPLEQIDVTRMILNARKRLFESERGVSHTKNFGFGYYHRIASLEPKNSKGVLCHNCRSIIRLGESFAKKSSKGKPYHLGCAKQLNLI
ncbi:MAG: hypothetical protein GEU26_16570 [Nitrososphaeraceae archaeon]|nr:hypothetical protein [Nitrososphaeraceae archaeon]